jgi:formate hydrogenlyase transcriptional activator
LTVPLIAGGRIIGTFNVSSRAPDSYGETDIQFLSLVAGQIAVAIDNATAYEHIERLKSELDRENQYLREEIKTDHNFEEIIGASAVLKKVLERVSDVAGTDSSVLITGETGTGKELIARAVHQRSKRAQKALIKVNCAALPVGLSESELFGHEKGAFTGAVSRHIGRFELADGGTILLDEIGDLSLEVQAKLLRVLQEREFERVGGTQSIKVDVRVIAATNRNLEEAVKHNRFRADLYYRLNVFPIHLPPIRERRDDIPLLARFFVNRYMIKMGKRIEKIAPDAMDRLVAYSWPGNIRELENIIERAVILCKGPTLHVEDELAPSHPAGTEDLRPLTLEDVERGHIVKVLEQTRGVIEGHAGAAKILKIHPNTLRSRMQKLGIQRDRHDSS